MESPKVPQITSLLNPDLRKNEFFDHCPQENFQTVHKENNLPKIIHQGKYIVRPIKQDDVNKEKSFKEKKEKIKKKREEKKKNLDKEF